MTAETASPARAWVEEQGTGVLAALVFVVFLCVYAATASYRLPISVDVFNTALPAAHLANQGDLDLSAHAEYITSRPVVESQFVKTETGWYSGRNIGVILLATPAYLLAGEQDPGVLPPLWPATLVAVVACSAAMALLFVASSRLVRPLTALGVVAAMGLSTGIWTTAADSLWTHGPAVLLLAASLMALGRGHMLLAGLAMGVSMSMRPELAVAAGGLGAWLAWETRSVRTLLRFAVGPAAMALGLLVYNGTVLGAWTFVAGYRESGMFEASVTDRIVRFPRELTGALVSSKNGLLLYSPYLVALLPGLRRAWTGAPAWVRAAALAGLAHFLMILVLQGNGDGNFFFGYRFPIEMLMLSAPLLTCAWRHQADEDRRWVWLFGAMVVASASFHGLAAMFEWRR